MLLGYRDVAGKRFVDLVNAQVVCIVSCDRRARFDKVTYLDSCLFCSAYEVKQCASVLYLCHGLAKVSCSVQHVF
jgi:hypothetical protein